MPDRPSHTWRRRLRLPALLLVVVALLVLLLPQLVRPRIERAASAALQTPVRIAWLGLEGFTGEVGVRGVAIGDADALTVERIVVRTDLRALLDRRIVLERIELDGLVGTVEQDANGHPALRGLPFPSAGDESQGPAVRVQEIALEDVRVALVPPPQLRRTPIELSLDDVLLRQVPTADEGPSWEGELTGALDGVPLTASARADRTATGTRISAEAKLTGAEIDARRLVLPPGFTSLSARAGGRLTYELDPAQRRDRVTADLEVADVRLSGDQQTSLATKLARVDGLTLDLASGEANLGHVLITGPRIEAALGPNGLVYPGLVPALVESGIAPPDDARPGAAEPPAKSAWRVVGGRIEAKDGSIAIRRDDHRVVLDVPSFAWRDVASGRSGDLRLTVRTSDGGTIDVDGRLGIDPATIDATVQLARIDLPSLTALAAPPLALARGTASGTIGLRGAPAAPAIDATLDVQQLHTAPPSTTASDHVLAVDQLQVRVDITPGPTGAVHIASLQLSYPYAMIARATDGIFPLDVLGRAAAAPTGGSEAATAEPAPPSPTAAPAGRTIRIDALTIDGGRLDFVDHTTSPAYWMGIAAIAGSVRDSSIVPGTLGRLDLDAKQDELHPISVSARRAAEQHWQGRASLQDLSLATLNPYLTPILGYEAQAGTVSVDVAAELDGTRLSAAPAFALDDVSLRQTGLDVIQRETGVPLTVALGLLKDIGGEIALDVPVEIDTRTGEYALGSFVTQAIGRAVLGALSSPLRWLGMLFGTDGSPHALAIDPVPFVAGSAALDATGTTRVGQIARILQSHADLDVILKAQIAPADRDQVGDGGLAQLARQRVEAVRAAFASGRGEAPILPARLIVAEWTPPASGALDAAPAVYVEVQSR
jgi:uncharacterized protein involved in outer membrane biogenesis